MASSQESDLPVISDLRDFDFHSGTFLERLVFNNRPTVVVLCVLVTLVLGYLATGIRLQAGFEKTLPKSHPYVLNYRANQTDLKGLGNNLTAPRPVCARICLYRPGPWHNAGEPASF